MGITEETVRRLKRDYVDLSAVARRSDMPLAAGVLGSAPETWHITASNGPVVAVRVGIEGIRGGRRSVRCRYDLIVDTTDLVAAIPEVWVVSPPDQEIKHVNIWPARKSFCKWTSTNLPSFCWYKFAVSWLDAPARSRTLGAALEYAKQFLNTENHDSPAR